MPYKTNILYTEMVERNTQLPNFSLLLPLNEYMSVAV